MAAAKKSSKSSKAGESRRDFLLYATTAVGAVGAGLAAWPFIDSMSPAADVLALAETEADLSKIEEGQGITVVWQKQPVFIRRRTQEEIEAARKVDLDDLRDPQPDNERVKDGREEWLIVVGNCTHLGCIPIGNQTGERRGDWGGWFCPCHNSHYDTSGRVRKGPAPKNLIVPPYMFAENDTVVIGKEEADNGSA